MNANSSSSDGEAHNSGQCGNTSLTSEMNAGASTNVYENGDEQDQYEYKALNSTCDETTAALELRSDSLD